ncbi:membrane protein [Helicobacter pylori]|nr:membrane protein [Helicobacter pylori]
MVSFFALYYGVIFENGDKLALNGVFMGNACVFLAAFIFLKTRSF